MLISWQAQLSEPRCAFKMPPSADFVAGAALCASSVDFMQVQISWQAQRCMNLQSADFVAGAGLCEP